jgi:nitroreductase
MKKRSAEFYAEMKRRRTVRQFSDRSVPREVIEDCLRTAATAPSGANMQPWSFIVVTNPDVKRQIREEAEKTEREFYHKNETRKWVEDLKLLGLFNLYAQ